MAGRREAPPEGETRAAAGGMTQGDTTGHGGQAKGIEGITNKKNETESATDGKMRPFRPDALDEAGVPKGTE